MSNSPDAFHKSLRRFRTRFTSVRTCSSLISRDTFPATTFTCFHNVVTVPSADILIEFYRQTTYYDAAAEAAIRAAVEDEIGRSGRFQYEKNGYLIIGFVDG